MRARWWVVALTLALLTGAACRSSARSDGEARLHLEAEPAHLQPLVGVDHLALRVLLGDVYEPLWEASREGALRPVLAASWTRSADDREWTFQLREGVRWHDGKPFSAEDVAYTLRLLAPGPGRAPTPLASDFDDLEAIDLVDAHTVRLRFAGFRVGRDQTLARVAILPAHVFAGTKPAELVAHAASRAPIGTGPYAFVSWEVGRAIRLARWEGWWGAPRPTVAKVVYRIVPDRAQALAQLRDGTLDFLAQVPAADADGLAGHDGLRLQPYDAPTFTAVTWNARRPALGDARVRRALTQLLDRDTVVREVLRGRARLQSAPWRPGDPACDPAVVPWPFDPEAARALLSAAGPGSLTVRLLYPATSSAVERVATIWREDARRAGVELVLEPQPFDVVVRRAQAGDFDGVVMSWASSPEQDLYAQLHSSQVGDGNNWGAFADAEVDRLLAAIRTTPDESARHADEHRLHRRLHELEPLTIVAGDLRTAVVGRRLGGVVIGDIATPVRLMSILE